MKKKNKSNSKSPYEPQALPGMKYIPQGYEPVGFSNPKEFKESDLAYRIYKKQRAYYDNE